MSTLAAARAEMDAIAARLAREFPDTDGGGWGAMVMPMQDAIVGDSRTMLLMLLGAVGARAPRRLRQCRQPALHPRAEPAQGDRDSLGARRRTRRVFQQLLVEAVVLAAVGGAIGLLLAWATLSRGLLAAGQPRAARR